MMGKWQGDSSKLQASEKYRYTDNQSNYSAYEYQRNLVLLTVGRSF